MEPLNEAREAVILKYALACKRNASEMAGMPVGVVIQHFREFADEIAALSEQGEAAQPAAEGWQPVPEAWELEAAAIFMDHVDDDETESVHRVAAFLRRVAASPGIASQAEEGSE